MAKAMKNIEFLIDGVGQVTIGAVGPIPCAAIASDDDQMLVSLVRRAGESLQELLLRLDTVLGEVFDGADPVDEINAPPPRPTKGPARAKGARGR